MTIYFTSIEITSIQFIMKDKTIYSLFVLFLSLSIMPRSVASDMVKPTSLFALISNSEKYNKQRVSTVGVLSVSESAIKVCVDRPSADLDITLNCLIIQRDSDYEKILSTRNTADYDGQYVMIRGLYDSSDPKPPGFVAVIRNIEEIRPLPLLKQL